MKITISFGGLFILFFFLSCGKPCNLPDYTFSVSDIFTPEKDSINIGDTLWLISTIQKNQIDINTGAQVDFSNAESLASDISISDISHFTSQRGAVDSFNFIKIHGNIYGVQDANPQGTKQLSFEETNNSYLLEVGLIAKKSGNYILTVNDNPYVFRRGSGKCGKGSFYFFNANSNKHLYLFEDVWGQLSTHDENRSYCFKVK